RYPKTGLSLTTRSPSSTTSMRNTPCVDGCWGPMEISSRSVEPLASGADLGRSSYCFGGAAGIKISALLLIRESLHLGCLMLFCAFQDFVVRSRLILVVVRLDVIFPHGMVGEFIPHENPPQVGVSVEDDAIQVVRLAFLK